MSLVEAYVGEIRLFAGTTEPRGWAFCDGRLLNSSENRLLSAVLGATYGGDGRTTFALPDLRGRVPIHPSEGDWLGQASGGELVATSTEDNSAQTTSTLTLNYIICLTGVIPDRS